AVLDPDGYRDETAEARRWLEQQQGSAPSFAALVDGVLERVRADVSPRDLGADAATRAQKWIDGEVAPPRDEAADVLLELVACQTANTRLDRAQEPEGGEAGAWSAAQEKAFAWLASKQKDCVFDVPDTGLAALGLLALQTKPKSKR